MRKPKLLTLLVLLVLAATPVTALAAETVPEARTARLQGAVSGTIVYTADALDTNEDGVVDSADSDVMYSIEIGADPADGRFFIAGGPPDSAAYPRLSQDGEIILCHAFVDTNEDGVIDHDTDMPFLAAINPDGTDLILLSEPGAAVALESQWAPDERSMVFIFADQDTDGDGAITIHDTRHLAWKPLGGNGPANTTASDLASEADFVVLTGDTLSVSRPQFWTNTLVLFEAERVADGRRGVYAYDLANDELSRLSPADMDAWNPQVSRDRTQVAMEVATDRGTRVWVYRAESGEWTDRTPAGATQASAPGWSPEGDWLAMAVATDAGANLVVDNGTETIVLASNAGDITMTAFSPGGDAVAYAAVVDEEHIALAVTSLDGSYAAVLTPEDSNVVDFVWAPSAPATSAVPVPTTLAAMDAPVADRPAADLPLADRAQALV